MIMLFLGKETEKIYNSQQDKKKNPRNHRCKGLLLVLPQGIKHKFLKICKFVKSCDY